MINCSTRQILLAKLNLRTSSRKSDNYNLQLRPRVRTSRNERNNKSIANKPLIPLRVQWVCMAYLPYGVWVGNGLGLALSMRLGSEQRSPEMVGAVGRL